DPLPGGKVLAVVGLHEAHEPRRPTPPLRHHHLGQLEVDLLLGHVALDAQRRLEALQGEGDGRLAVHSEVLHRVPEHVVGGLESLAHFFSVSVPVFVRRASSSLNARSHSVSSPIPRWPPPGRSICAWTRSRFPPSLCSALTTFSTVSLSVAASRLTSSRSRPWILV